MKNQILLPITGLLLLFATAATGQSSDSHFHYYQNRKVPLVLNTDQDDLVIDENVPSGATEFRAANQTLTATNIIRNNASATYYTGNKVLLKPGFHAQKGALFRASARVASSNSSNEAIASKIVPSDPLANVDKELIFYPNPVEESLFIQSSDPSAYHISLYSGAGEQLMDIDPKDQLNELDVSHLPTGIYFIHLFSNESGELTVKKVIVQ